MKFYQGFGLPELLISLLLASIIMTTLIQFYLDSKRQYIQAQKLLAARFDVLWVSDLLSDSIRRAGFTPCLAVEQLYVIDRRNGARIHSGLLVENKPGQSIKINRMSEDFSQVIKIPNSFQFVLSSSAFINGKRPIIIADCKHAEVHTIQQVEHVKEGYLVTLNKPLKFSYQASAYAGDWLEEQWFIKKNSTAISALYYRSFHLEELSSLIHSLQIKEQLIHEKRLIDIEMGLDGGKVHQLRVAVRGTLRRF